MPWFYAKNRQQRGPVDDGEFDRLIAAGEILPTDLVWQPGQPQWRPLSEIRPGAITVPAAAAAVPPAEAAPAAAPVHAAVTAAAAATAASAARAARPYAAAPAAAAGPVGVGGWLLFFCVLLTIIGPLYGLSGWIQLAPRILSGSIPYAPTLFFALGTQLLLVVASIAIGAMIWSGRPDGRSLARKYLLARAGYIAALQILNFGLAFLGSGSVPGYLVGILIRVILMEGAFFLVWWFYFQKSVRVRNTYGPE